MGWGMRETLVKTEEFKDSPVGRIPKDWDVKPLSELADVDRGKFTHRPRNDPRFYGGSYPFIQTGDIANSSGGILSTYSQTLNERGITVSREFPVGTIAITIAANIADTAILGIPMFFPDSVVGAVVKKPNSIRYVELCIRRAKQRLDARAPQSAQKNINLEDLRPLLIPVPCPEEQHKIAEVIDTIEEAIAHTSSLIAKLKQMKAGLLHDLLTRGLDENGELRDAIAHPEQFKPSPLGRIPKDWGVYPLKECVYRDAQITYGIVQAGSHVEGGVPYIRTGDMARDRLSIEGLLRTSPQIAASYHRSKVRTGEIVCAIRATVGKVLEVPPELDGANLTQGTARIAPREDINNHFLLWALRSSYAQRQFDLAVKGTTFSEITLENLRDIKVALPSHREEQDKIAEILDSHDTRIRAEEVYRDKLKLQKQGLMHDLLTGKVRVKNA